MMWTQKGIMVSPGIAVGEVYQIPKRRTPSLSHTTDDVTSEKRRLLSSLQLTKERLHLLQCKVEETTGPNAASIFAIHIAILEDPAFEKALFQALQQKHLTAESAVNDAAHRFSRMFTETGDAYMMARASDIADLSRQLIAELSGIEYDVFAAVSSPVIVAAEHLLPSQTVGFDNNLVLGFLSKMGSANSHAAILARSLGVPALTALGGTFDRIRTGDTAIIDADNGLLFVNPDSGIYQDYLDRMAIASLEKERQKRFLFTPSCSADGTPVTLLANIGHPDETKKAYELGAEGVGLFRSEYLYLGGEDFPTEQEQFLAYKRLLETDPTRTVVMRTLDFGADKQPSYFEIPNEANPALGYRAIRISLEHPEIFETQLRAMLRASVYGKLSILFPMLTDEKEFHRIRSVVYSVRQALQKEGVPIAEHIPLGVMIETPAAVMLADRLAKSVDFFSIGTNDLTQYTLAVDRVNPRVADLFNPGHPAILRMIRQVAKAAHDAGIPVSICGESAANSALLPHYLALGVDELSMSPYRILQVKEALLSLDKAVCQKETEQFLL